MIRWFWEWVVGGHWHSWEYYAPHYDSFSMGQIMRCNECGKRKYRLIVNREPIIEMGDGHDGHNFDHSMHGRGLAD